MLEEKIYLQEESEIEEEPEDDVSFSEDPDDEWDEDGAGNVDMNKSIEDEELDER